MRHRELRLGMSACTIWARSIALVLPAYNAHVKIGATKRTAALLEVLGVYLAGALLNDRIVAFVTQHHLISDQNPFALLTVHASNADLLLASRQLALAFFFIYFSFFVIVVPLEWCRGRRGPATYGLTRAGKSLKALLVAGVAAAALSEWPVLIHSLVDAIHPLGAMAAGVLRHVLAALAILAVRRHLELRRGADRGGTALPGLLPAPAR